MALSMIGRRLISAPIAAAAFLWSGAAVAEPFCVVTTDATHCWYSDAASCLHAADAAGGACVANTSQEASDPQTKPFNDGAAAPAFCVVTATGADCAYFDKSACEQAANSSHGACVANANR